jgi:GNAT superfamily N-acetyltransferase
LSTRTALDAEPSLYLATSASGAGLRSIPPAAALEFFERYSGRTNLDVERLAAWGAFEDHATVIGACGLARVSDTACRAQVAVVPERRRLGIGGELVGILIHQAARNGARRLIGSHPASAIEARRMVASLGLVSARRVQDGSAKVVVFLPETAAL